MLHMYDWKKMRWTARVCDLPTWYNIVHRCREMPRITRVCASGPTGPTTLLRRWLIQRRNNVVCPMGGDTGIQAENWR